MGPEDVRHGSNRGYVVGCRDECCTAAHRRYMKLYRMGRQPRMVSPIGTQRRIEALLALGWTARDISERCGRGTEWARMVSRSERVTSHTATIVAKVYDDLCMTVPDDAYYYRRNRRRAARKGYLPPLAWDNIDDPDEHPVGWRYIDPDRADALAEMDAARLGITEVCKRLDVRRDNLEKWCSRRGLTPLYSRLIAREQPRYWRNGVAEAVS